MELEIEAQPEVWVSELTVSGSDVGRVWQSDFLRDNNYFFVFDRSCS